MLVIYFFLSLCDHTYLLTSVLFRRAFISFVYCTFPRGNHCVIQTKRAVIIILKFNVDCNKKVIIECLHSMAFVSFVLCYLQIGNLFQTHMPHCVNVTLDLIVLWVFEFYVPDEFIFDFSPEFKLFMSLIFVLVYTSDSISISCFSCFYFYILCMK